MHIMQREKKAEGGYHQQIDPPPQSPRNSKQPFPSAEASETRGAR